MAPSAEPEYLEYSRQHGFPDSQVQQQGVHYAS